MLAYNVVYNIEIQVKEPSKSHTYKLLCLHSYDRSTNLEIRTLEKIKIPIYWSAVVTTSCSKYEMKFTTYSSCSRQKTHSLCIGRVAHLSQVHHRTFFNQLFHSTLLLSFPESLACSSFKRSHTKAQRNKHIVGWNDVTDMWSGLEDPFKMVAPGVKLFIFFH